MDRKDWDELDRLLGLEGFGGYYDLVECIKYSVGELAKDLGHHDGFADSLSEVKTVKRAVAALQALSLMKHPSLRE